MILHVLRLGMGIPILFPRHGLGNLASCGPSVFLELIDSASCNLHLYHLFAAQICYVQKSSLLSAMTPWCFRSSVQGTCADSKVLRIPRGAKAQTGSPLDSSGVGLRKLKHVHITSWELRLGEVDILCRSGRPLQGIEHV